MADSDLQKIRESGNWSRYEVYVMESLASVKQDLRALRIESADYRRCVDADIAALKVKVGAMAVLFGAIGGAIPVALVLLMK